MMIMNFLREYLNMSPIAPLALMRGADSKPSRVTDGLSQPISPRIRIQSLVDCFGLGAHVCAAVAFLVVRLIRIGQIDGIRREFRVP